MTKSIRVLLSFALGYLAFDYATASRLTVEIPALTESSGLAFSTRSNDLLFSHNDSGDRPRLFAFNRQGKLVYELQVEKAKANDWEDMCSFEHDGGNWLAVGDIGDNDRLRDFVSIYVFKEPKEKTGDRQRKAEVEYALQVEYPTGAVDSESLAYDPLTHSFVLLSKETFNCVVYQVPIPAAADGVHRIKAKAIGKYLIPMTTGADISRDGKRLVICTYGPACLVERNPDNPNQPWDVKPEELASKYFEVPPRRQGETICFDPSGEQIWLTSEHTPTPLIEVTLPKH